jgi:pullulanase/glycogen debranching enzyme
VDWATSPLFYMSNSHWYKNAVFYEISVRAFKDSDGDGHGDLRGLTEKVRLPANPRRGLHLDHADLPFASARRRLRHCGLLQRGLPTGRWTQLKVMIEAAHQRNIRIIMDLVLNHTSDAHPWFPGCALRQELSLSRLLRLERYRSNLQRRAHHLSGNRAIQLDMG